MKDKPHAKYKFLTSPRCGAKTRNGTACKAPAMKNGRCRMHGGMSTGPPKGTQNALKHGFYTKKSKGHRAFSNNLIEDCKSLILKA